MHARRRRDDLSFQNKHAIQPSRYVTYAYLASPIRFVCLLVSSVGPNYLVRDREDHRSQFLARDLVRDGPKHVVWFSYEKVAYYCSRATGHKGHMKQIQTNLFTY
jgi:hypothetical protein